MLMDDRSIRPDSPAFIGGGQRNAIKVVPAFTRGTGEAGGLLLPTPGRGHVQGLFGVSRAMLIVVWPRHPTMVHHDRLFCYWVGDVAGNQQDATVAGLLESNLRVSVGAVKGTGGLGQKDFSESLQ